MNHHFPFSASAWRPSRRAILQAGLLGSATGGQVVQAVSGVAGGAAMAADGSTIVGSYHAMVSAGAKGQSKIRNEVRARASSRLECVSVRLSHALYL